MIERMERYALKAAAIVIVGGFCVWVVRMATGWW